ncbi:MULTISPECIES: STAS domain-containing protein [Chloroflexus]|jgi:anti-anti-sigma factor|uniref:Anti-sigma factor antagonist n=1 Tax=Chloroflexus aggregans (strain MD-66 / DSM 9485) TaxID=326427 RepID=B8G6T6_CHLAD|nr:MULTISPECIES: STAS domain-containing protein [Chloroflexus]ACL25895.1 anti-sigma-factor antagonist [Chloroflexus aggregans DSM 9485]GIV87762.1 MAG: anti-sigma factor antagonist [Chloroflexus sp.]
MLEDELNVNIRHREGVAIIDLIGDVTTFAEEKINNAYRQVTTQGARYILLNFRQNDYINSAGIAILIGIVTEVNQNGQKLAISGLSPHFQKIFRMVGLAQYAEIYQTEEEALSAFKRLSAIE